MINVVLNVGEMVRMNMVYLLMRKMKMVILNHHNKRMTNIVNIYLLQLLLIINVSLFIYSFIYLFIYMCCFILFYFISFYLFMYLFTHLFIIIVVFYSNGLGYV